MRVIVGLLVLGGAARAQPAPPIPEKPLYFGPRLGVGASWLGGADIVKQNFEERIGISAGGFAMLALTRLLAVEGGLAYSQKGNAFADGTLKLDYLQAELSGLVRAQIGQDVRIRGIYGATLAYNVRARLAISEADNTIREDIEPFDVGLVLGVGIESSTTVGKIIVDGRYEHGLRRIDGVGDRDQIRNRRFTVTAGFGF